MEAKVFDIIAAHEGQDGSYPSVPLISDLTGHARKRLYKVLARLVTLGLIERVGSVLSRPR
jgi:DNA-binding IclR family transcriptional regulator